MYIFEASILGFHIAPTWYGFMYAIGFSFCYFFVGKYSQVKKSDMDTLLLYIFFGVIGGGRLGYILLYNPSYFLSNPEEAIAIWNGGMSFHGGLLGVLIAVYIFSWKYRYRFFEITDILAICLPVALGLGRIGNWINSELPGYAGYTGPLAMTIGDISYFPSPLLQAGLEGIILLVIMLFFWKFQMFRTLNFRSGTLSAVFLIGYASVRLFAEQFRLPDEHVGYLLGTGWVTLGILYTLPMLIIGVGILMWTGQKKETNE